MREIVETTGCNSMCWKEDGHCFLGYSWYFYSLQYEYEWQWFVATVTYYNKLCFRIVHADSIVDVPGTERYSTTRTRSQVQQAFSYRWRSFSARFIFNQVSAFCKYLIPPENLGPWRGSIEAPHELLSHSARLK